MASCTAVTYANGELVGDPLDVNMFRSTGWILDEAVPSGGFGDQVILAYVHPSDCEEAIRASEHDSPASSSHEDDALDANP